MMPPQQSRWRRCTGEQCAAVSSCVAGLVVGWVVGNRWSTLQRGVGEAYMQESMQFALVDGMFVLMGG